MHNARHNSHHEHRLSNSHFLKNSNFIVQNPTTLLPVKMSITISSAAIDLKCNSGEIELRVFFCMKTDQISRQDILLINALLKWLTVH